VGSEPAVQAAGRMWLIVGLGNPGIDYAWTPHNLGFLAVDRLADKAGIRVERPEAKASLATAKSCSPSRRR